ncbi:MAG: hypothetical protein LQ340_000076 [Diploschistes diacapsis]|nr:MAG: hypothetical protein LQ340_000076 [Diploschistes diacapsis]
MALQRGIKPRPGHDDCSVRPMKKQKPQSSETEMKPGGTQKTYANHTPDCGPSERMEKLSARVDISFPITGHTKTSRGAELVSTKASQTKTERKLQRMQEEWRALDARRKERVKEAREEVEAQYQHTEFWKAVAPKRKISKHSRGTQSARMANGEHDPLMCTGAKQGRSGSLVGLHDVVKEPPRMSCIPTKKLQSRNGAAFDPFVIPEASGSIYKREQLSEVRREVIDGYRKRKAI